MTPAPSICQNVLFLGKKTFKCRTEIVLFGYFWAGTRRSYCDVLHQHPQIFPNTKFRPKIKILKFGTKIALIGYFGLEFQKPNVLFKISILEFVNMQPFIQKQKSFKLGTKNTLFR